MNILPQRLPREIQDGIGRAVGGVGITPNMISLFGFFGNLLAAWLITREELLFAGLVYLFFSALDMVDGAVARATGLASSLARVSSRISSSRCEPARRPEMEISRGPSPRGTPCWRRCSSQRASVMC